MLSILNIYNHIKYHSYTGMSVIYVANVSRRAVICSVTCDSILANCHTNVVSVGKSLWPHQNYGITWLYIPRRRTNTVPCVWSRLALARRCTRIKRFTQANVTTCVRYAHERLHRHTYYGPIWKVTQIVQYRQQERCFRKKRYSGHLEYCW